MMESFAMFNVDDAKIFPAWTRQALLTPDGGANRDAASPVPTAH
jgi:hypothetical protein